MGESTSEVGKLQRETLPMAWFCMHSLIGTQPYLSIDVLHVMVAELVESIQWLIFAYLMSVLFL